MPTFIDNVFKITLALRAYYDTFCYFSCEKFKFNDYQLYSLLWRQNRRVLEIVLKEIVLVCYQFLILKIKEIDFFYRFTKFYIKLAK